MLLGGVLNSFVSVQPPIIAIPGLRFTTWPFAFFSTKQVSRVVLMWRGVFAVASSPARGPHLSEPGRRTLGLVSRLGLLMSSRRVAPLGQSVPRLIGWSGSPSTWTTEAVAFLALSPSVWMTTPHETAQ